MGIGVKRRDGGKIAYFSPLFREFSKGVGSDAARSATSLSRREYNKWNETEVGSKGRRCCCRRRRSASCRRASCHYCRFHCIYFRGASRAIAFAIANLPESAKRKKIVGANSTVVGYRRRGCGLKRGLKQLFFVICFIIRAHIARVTRGRVPVLEGIRRKFITISRSPWIRNYVEFRGNLYRCPAVLLSAAYLYPDEFMANFFSREISSMCTFDRLIC